jgi:hypothetical protein
LNGKPVPGISPNGGTQNLVYLQRFYGGKLPACSNSSYSVSDPLVGSGQCGWSNGITYYANDFDTHYNSLQVTLTKQFSHGLQMNANYAWQKAISWASGYSTWSKSAVYGNDDSVRRQQIVIYGLYELPFGKNKLIGANVNGVMNEIIGGWQLSPVLNYSSGLPFTLSYSSCAAAIPSDAPCYVNGVAAEFQPHITGFPGNNLNFFDAQTLGTKFTAPGLDQIGNIGRNSVWGPHFFNMDLAVQKNFPIHEAATVQFRMDAFNVFNHINFGTPSGNIEQAGAIGTGAGKDGTANPRQLQFSLRVLF